VNSPGNVLLFCAEDAAHDVRTRAAGIAKARGADFDRLAVGWIGVPELHLDDLVHRQRLRKTVFDLKPRLLILDPLVRLHRGDENSALAISELLGVLRSLQRDLHVAVVLVHHVRKSGASEPRRTGLCRGG
jgi:RecA-family ATPase